MKVLVVGVEGAAIAALLLAGPEIEVSEQERKDVFPLMSRRIDDVPLIYEPTPIQARSYGPQVRGKKGKVKRW